MLTSGNILQERYQLQKQLGRTAAGRQTWLSTDLHTREEVTVKLLAFSPQMKWEELKLFEREAQVLQSLDHPRIPRYRDYFSLDREAGSGLPWFALVQDYIPGFSLQELIEKGKRFNESQIKIIAKNVLEILVYLHQLSPPVLHRDIKPSNLIYGKDKQIYLIDFGAVQAQAHVTGVTFTVVGTSGYAPLEQFWGRAVAASDLYALGATLIHVLTGIYPADLPQKDSRILFSDRVTISPHFISWLETITEISVEKRFQTAKVALEHLTETKNPNVLPSQSANKETICQPKYSRIKVIKSADEFNIHLPSKGLKKLLDINDRTGSKIFLVIYLIFLHSFISLAFSEEMVMFVEILFMFIYSMFAIITFRNLIVSVLEQNYITLSQNQIEYKPKYGGAVWKAKSVYFSKILGVFMTKIDSQKYAVTLRCETKTSKTFQVIQGLTEEECLWLAHEIQDWLNSR